MNPWEPLVTLTKAEAEALYAMACTGLTVLRLDDVPNGYEAVGKLARALQHQLYPGCAGTPADAAAWNARHGARPPAPQDTTA